jgi:hypothetical protein
MKKGKVKVLIWKKRCVLFFGFTFLEGDQDRRIRTLNTGWKSGDRGGEVKTNQE